METNKILVNQQNQYINNTDKIIENADKTIEKFFNNEIKNSTLLVERLNYTVSCGHKIFQQLKNDIESKYEEVENTAIFITKLIETNNHNGANIALDYLNDLIIGLRKKIY